MSPSPPSGRDRSGHDLRLLAPTLSAWLSALVLLAGPPRAAYLCAAACALTALLLTRRRRRPSRPVSRLTVVAALVCAAASAAGVGLRLSSVGSGPVRALALSRATVTLEVVLTGDPQPHLVHGRALIIATARAEAVDRPPAADRARAPEAPPGPGSEPDLADLRTADPSRSAFLGAAGVGAGRAVVAGGPGTRVGVRVPVLLLARDPRWLGLLPGQRIQVTGRLTAPRHAELLAAVVLARGRPQLLGRPPPLQRAAEAVRAALRRATGGLPADQRGVLPGMVTGDTSRMPPGLGDTFRAAGLSHLLVVSGENLAITCGAVLALCRFAGIGRKGSAVLAAVAVLAFVVVARPDPSVLRAAVMSLVGLLALSTGRPRQGLPALCGAVLILLLADPELARSYGFVLSVLATAGLLVLAPPLRTRLEKRLPRRLAEVLAMALAAELACAPVVVMLSGAVCLVAVPANLLAEPAVVPATLLGALTAPVALAAPPAARILVRPAGLAVAWIVGVARVAAQVPYGRLPWPAGPLGAVLLVGALLLLVAVVRRPWPRRVAAAILAGVLIAVLALRLLAPGWPPPGWVLVVCDVGQGDALVLSTGSPHAAVVLDAGPDPALVDRCLSDLGISSVPVLILSHPHADHIDGVPGVRHGRTVGTVLPTPLTAGEEERFVPGLPVRAVGPGAAERIGELSLTILAPGPDGPRVSTRDPGTVVNNASLVIVARWPGVSALLPGDAETEAQQALAARLPPVDVLKVAHHGSPRQDPGFLAATHARLAIISVGANNDYGHPAPRTLDLLTRLGMRVYRTDHNGTVAVIRTRSGVAAITRPTRP